MAVMRPRVITSPRLSDGSGLPVIRGLGKGDLVLSPFYQAENGLGVVTA